MFSLPSRIRFSRTKARLTQAQLAKLVGVQRTAVTQWERAQGTSPTVDHLIRIALHTEFSFEWLATGHGAPHTQEEHEENSVVLGDFALNEFESSVLDLIRSIPRHQRTLTYSILQLLAKS